jgi:flagellar biosynthesis/type III secretory pathway protein FliH
MAQPGHRIVVVFHAPLASVTLAPEDAPLPEPPLRVQAPPPAPEPAPVRPSEALEAEAARQRDEEKRVIRGVLDGVAAAAQRVEREHRARIAEWQQAAVELAVTIATRLVHDRVRADAFAVETVVREAAALLGPHGPFTVRLHPADLALLESRLGGQPLLGEGSGMVVVTSDAALPRGDCRVDGTDAGVSSRLGDQLALVRAELLRSLADA